MIYCQFCAGALLGTGAIYFLLRSLFSLRDRVPALVRCIAYLLCTVLWAALALQPISMFFYLVYGFAAVLVLARSFYEVRNSQALLAALVFTAVYGIVQMIFSTIAHSLVGAMWNELTLFPHQRALALIDSHLILLLLLVLVHLVARRNHTAITLPFILMLLPGYIITVVVSFSKSSPVLIIASIGLLYMDLLAVFYAERIKLLADRQQQAALAQQHYELQEAYHAQLRSDQNETRAMFHDIQKYMLAMKSLVQEQSSAEAQELLIQTQQLQDCIGTVVDVGNPIINVILNEYLHKAEEDGIRFSYQVSIPPSLSLSAVDCYILLGNTLDNALEAVQSMQELPEEQPVIHVQLKQQNNLLFYQVDNPYPPDYFQRTRGKQHGYGLQNVQRCVKKYGGDTMTSSENGRFIFSAHLNLD